MSKKSINVLIYHRHRLLNPTYFSLHITVSRSSVMTRGKEKVHSVAKLHITIACKGVEAKLQAFLTLVLQGGELSKFKAADKSHRRHSNRKECYSA
jgi:hypothetical protein